MDTGDRIWPESKGLALEASTGEAVFDQTAETFAIQHELRIQHKKIDNACDMML